MHILRRAFLEEKKFFANACRITMYEIDVTWLLSSKNGAHYTWEWSNIKTLATFQSLVRNFKHNQKILMKPNQAQPYLTWCSLRSRENLANLVSLKIWINTGKIWKKLFIVCSRRNLKSNYFPTSRVFSYQNLLVHWIHAPPSFFLFITKRHPAIYLEEPIDPSFYKFFFQFSLSLNLLSVAHHIFANKNWLLLCLAQLLATAANNILSDNWQIRHGRNPVIYVMRVRWNIRRRKFSFAVFSIVLSHVFGTEMSINFRFFFELFLSFTTFT